MGIKFGQKSQFKPRQSLLQLFIEDDKHEGRQHLLIPKVKYADGIEEVFPTHIAMVTPVKYLEDPELLDLS